MKKVFSIEFFNKDDELLNHHTYRELDKRKVADLLNEKEIDELNYGGYDISPLLKEYILSVYPDLKENFQKFDSQITGNA